MSDIIPAPISRTSLHSGPPRKGFWATLKALILRPKALQVAMLCTRHGPKGLEVLLVKSLDSGRWILPKGWPMKGRSLVEAATIEAWEEAGAKGRVTPTEIARFKLMKRRNGGLEVPAEVVVFRMEETELAETYPEVGLRKRRFLPVEQAAARTDVEEIADLIRQQLIG